MEQTVTKQEARPVEPAHEVDEIARMLGLLKGHFRHKPHFYFLDLFLCLVLGYGGAAVYLTLSWKHPVLEVVSLVTAAAALFRLGCFIHEIAHMPRGAMRAFKVAWNITAGIPLGIPSFLYLNHLHHHSTKTYGTSGDGEYLPLRQEGGWKVFLSLLQIPLTLLLVPYRFLILVPATLLIPGGRPWLLKNASSYTMVPAYRYGKEPRSEAWWLWADLATSAWLWSTAFLFWTGAVPAAIAAKFQLLVFLGVCFNGFRNLFAHTYRSDGRPKDHFQQFEDSITIQAPWVVEKLFFPVGLKYHALHHLFPNIPYHEMGAVHRILTENLPEDSFYRKNVPSGLGDAARGLFFPAGGV